LAGSPAAPLRDPQDGGLLASLLVLTQEQCLASFMEAVRDGRRGQYVRAGEIVERVRQKAGDQAAETAKKELWAFIRSEKKTT
jgi:hypothetical protein